MRLFGELKYGGESFYIRLDDLKEYQRWSVINKYHKKDRFNILTGKAPTHEIFKNIYTLNKKTLDGDYVTESAKISRRKNDTHVYGRINIIAKILNSVQGARGYSFKSSYITVNKETATEAGVVHQFHANDRNVYIRYTTIDRLYTELELRDSEVELILNSNLGVSFKVDVPLEKTTGEICQDLKVKSTTSVSMNTLQTTHDLSWCIDKKTGKFIKDYSAIKNIPQFEAEVIDELCKTILENKKLGKVTDLALDTETSGLRMCYLSPNNPNKDFIVATPISWKDEQGVVVFNNMEYHENVPPDYMFSRLKVFLEKGDDIVVRSETHAGVIYKFKRSDINLIGHNVMFDGKVLYDNKIKPYWNNDTLQMAFNINPKVSKGKSGGIGLKAITRKMFNHETPELSDILGKGNEDKYRYIRDEKVAIIYGCADADYTRLIFPRLKQLMPCGLYEAYQEQDVPMLNILYISEYYGLLMDEKRIEEMASKAEKDLEIIKTFLWEYVGDMIYRTNKIRALEVKKKTGVIDPDELQNELDAIEKTKGLPYRFEMKATDLISVMYEKLGYPILAYTETGKPKIDKKVMKKLMTYKKEHSALLADVMDSAEGDAKQPLIEAKEFNKYQYPIAYVLSVYKTLEKEYTSYFKPLLKENLENRIFKGYKMARIETRRIMNPSQTMKGDLKALTLPFDGGKDYYMVDFDMAQVEYRIMASIAGLTSMITRLKDCEKDFHTESASALTGIPAHKIEKSFRKKMKSIHFGIPYGLGDISMCEAMFGVVNEKNLYETRKLMAEFKSKNKEVIEMLDWNRAEALKERPYSLEFKRFCGFTMLNDNGDEEAVPVGRVENLLGFYRLFDLSNMDNRKRGTIKRAAGNYPIQAYAAELFRYILIRFYNRCEKEGIADKIIWHMLIHDELLFSAHKSLNPFYLYKLILEECMIFADEVDGYLSKHTNYFVGINIGSNWAECKDDASEAPVKFVQRMVKRWDAGEFKDDIWIDNPKAYVDKYKHEYLKDRVGEVIEEIQPDSRTKPINLKHIDEHFENYTVRSYINDFFVPKTYRTDSGKPVKEWYKISDQDKFVMCMQQWALEKFGEEKQFLDFSNTIINSGDTYIPTSSGTVTDIEEDSFDALEAFKEDLQNSWSFNDEELDDYAENLYYEDKDIGEELAEYDYDDSCFDTTVKNAKNVVDLIVNKAKGYKHINNTFDRIIIKPTTTSQIPKIKEYLNPFLGDKGLRVSFMDITSFKSTPWLTVKEDIKLGELDKFIDKLADAEKERIDRILNKNKTNKPMTSFDDKQTEIKYVSEFAHGIIIRVPKMEDATKLSRQLKGAVQEGGKKVYFKVGKQVVYWNTINPNIDTNKLNKAIEEVI